MEKQPDKTTPASQQPGRSYAQPMREEAFDLYCTGLSHHQVKAQLAASYPDAAPGRATITRWAAEDRWKYRRDTIWQALRTQRDAGRALFGADYLAELHLLRGNLLATVDRLDFSSAEGALFGLAALERVIAREMEQLRLVGLNATYKPIIDAQLNQLKKLMGTPPGGLTPSDENHEPL